MRARAVPRPARAGVTSLETSSVLGEEMTEKNVNGRSIRLAKGDITDMDVEGFVFYATEDLVLGSGYGTAISVRGGPSIQEECRKLAPVPVGKAVVTGAGNLKAKYIIHAVGPKFQEPQEEEKLHRTVQAVLQKAEEKGIRRLALPAMGTGFYGIPLELCARVMVKAIREHLNGNTKIKEVMICVRDSREIAPFAKQIEQI